MSLLVRGIKSCDSCRKARRWLADEGLAYQWIDFQESRPSPAEVKRWLDELRPDALVNRKSATWRALDESERPALDSPAVIGLLVEHPTLIKRPLLERDGEFRTGFDDEQRDWLARA